MGGTIDGASLRIGRERRVRIGPWLLLFLPVALAFVLCYRPVMRLKAQPPPGFVETQPDWDATRQAAENRAAEAYWQLAINLVQWRFAFGSELPGEPIEEFKLDEKDFRRNSIAATPATRVRYWNKLRTVWTQPHVNFTAVDGAQVQIVGERGGTYQLALTELNTYELSGGGVPEPSVFGLIALGTALVSLRRRR